MTDKDKVFKQIVAALKQLVFDAYYDEGHNFDHVREAEEAIDRANLFLTNEIDT